MTKADIIDQIYEKIGFSKKESAEIVDLVFEISYITISKSFEILNTPILGQNVEK